MIVKLRNYIILIYPTLDVTFSINIQLKINYNMSQGIYTVFTLLNMLYTSNVITRVDIDSNMIAVMIL